MFIKKNIFNFNIKSIFFFILIILGIFTSVHRGYGDDIDSFALILTFINLLENGVYTPSRYYGYPFAELFYGFSGYYLGSFYSSIFSYFFFILSIFYLSKIFLNNLKNNELILLILICISNPVLFFDNTNPSDSPLSLFLFSLGTYMFYKNNKLFASILLGLTVATRPNYALFIILIYLFEIVKTRKVNYLLIKSFIIFSCVCLFFYFPILLKNDFNLGFISNPGGPELNFESLFYRFIYKIYLSLGVYSSIIIFIFLCFRYKKLYDLVAKNYLLFSIIIFNFITFYFMPTKTSIISLSIILIYFFLFKLTIKKNIIYIILVLNFFSYLVTYQFLEIKYKYEDKCAPIEAIDAKFKFKINYGYFFIRTSKIRSKIECDSRFFNEKSTKYLKGERLK